MNNNPIPAYALQNVEVLFKRLHPAAQLPRYAKPGDAGADITAVSVTKSGFIFPLYTYRTGLAFQLPPSHWAMLAARSSLTKLLLWLANGVGVIDAGYRGEILFKFRGFLWFKPYKAGDRIGQFILMKREEAAFTEVLIGDLEPSERGSAGFGSTGQ